MKTTKAIRDETMASVQSAFLRGELKVGTEFSGAGYTATVTEIREHAISVVLRLESELTQIVGEIAE